MKKHFWGLLPLAIATSGLSFAAHAALPQSGFISAASRADIAYDTIHDVLYISGSNSLLRYDLPSQSFLAPIALGGTTFGMDISPDGKTLAVANTSKTATKNFIDLIDLETGTSTRAGFNLSFSEGGTYTVAYDADGKLLVSSRFQGSGWTPLRKYDPVTGSTSTLGSVRQDTMLAASANHSVIAVAESNISSGPVGTYRTGDSSYRSAFDTYAFVFEVAASRDGSQLAIPTYLGTYIEDPALIVPSIGTYAGPAPIGAAYSPAKDSIYLPFSQSSYVAEYDTTTGLEVKRYQVDGTFDWIGNHAFNEGRIKVAADGSYFFVTLDSGVYFQSLTPVPEPEAYLMLVAGLGLVGIRTRRKQK